VSCYDVISQEYVTSEIVTSQEYFVALILFHVKLRDDDFLSSTQPLFFVFILILFLTFYVCHTSFSF